MLPDINTPRQPLSARPLDDKATYVVRAFEQSVRPAPPKGERWAQAVKKVRCPRTLEAWLLSELEAQGFAEQGPCMERLRIHRQCLAQLCDHLQSYRPILESVLAELDAALHNFDERAWELQKLRRGYRQLHSQQQVLLNLSNLQLEEAWAVAQQVRRDADDRSAAAQQQAEETARKNKENLAAIEETKKKQAKEKEQWDKEHLQKLSDMQKLLSEEAREKLGKEEQRAQREEQRAKESMAKCQKLEKELQEVCSQVQDLEKKLSDVEAEHFQEFNDLKSKLNFEQERASLATMATQKTLRLSDSVHEFDAEDTESHPPPIDSSTSRPDLYASSNFANTRTNNSIIDSEPDSDRPDGMATPEDVTDVMRNRQTRDPEKWTLTLSEWSDVIDCCQRKEKYQSMKKEGKRYINMYDVNDCFVKPWSKGTGCSLSVLMSKDREAAAQLMLSHAWAEDVEECQKAVVDFARNREPRIPETAHLWFCLFANYQADDGCGPSIQDQLEMKPFKTVIESDGLKKAAQGFGLNAIHTSTANLYKRLWCVHELERALKEDVEVSTSMSEKYKEKMMARLDLFLQAKGDTKWEDCLWAANVKVKTIQARCDRPEDEAMLVKEILSEGGFDELDKTIEAFRRKTFGKNYETMMKAVSRYGQSLEHASDELKQKRDLVQAAVQADGVALQFAGDFKQDKKLVLKAVNQNGQALQYADDTLRKDRDVVLTAITNDGLALEHADENLVTSAEDLIATAVFQNPKALLHVPEDYQEYALELLESRLDETGDEAESVRKKEMLRQGTLGNTVKKVKLQSEISVAHTETHKAEKKSQKAEEKSEAAEKLYHMIKSVRPQIRDIKPKKALKLIFKGLYAAFSDPDADLRWFSTAQKAIMDQFKAGTEEDKEDYADVLLDKECWETKNLVLKDALFGVIVQFKQQSVAKAKSEVQEQRPSSRQSLRKTITEAPPQLSRLGSL